MLGTARPIHSLPPGLKPTATLPSLQDCHPPPVLPLPCTLQDCHPHPALPALQPSTTVLHAGLGIPAGRGCAASPPGEPATSLPLLPLPQVGLSPGLPLLPQVGLSPGLPLLPLPQVPNNDSYSHCHYCGLRARCGPQGSRGLHLHAVWCTHATVNLVWPGRAGVAGLACWVGRACMFSDAGRACPKPWP